ncbi:MAG: DUF1501 domain-containing protein [Planctomycetaceae bacterium]|nr:DUF1501 domain-containing protein [Planctomycetaceae bacterium]
MFTAYGDSHGFCDGYSRRDFLRIGALGIAGLTLPQLLRAEAMAGARATGRSIINIYLAGGPTHLDTFDLKPAAPKEFRGEFTPIATKATGMDICELMPRLASCGDKFALVRSITDMRNEHSSCQSDSGWSERDMKSQGGRPGLGPVMSRVFGPAQTTPEGTAPTAMDLTGWTRPGFLGQVHAAYRPDGTGRQNLTLDRRMNESRFSDRQNLLTGLDRMRRQVDGSGMMEAMDSFTSRAVGMITSGRVAAALNIEEESVETIDRYGGKRSGEARNFLTARRLVEAGVRNVSLSIGGWDTHGNNFKSMRTKLPVLDQALSALIEDLHDRGRLDDTLIMMSGEFGRTPRINGNAGRDHWSQAAFFFLAGGGLRTGQVIGSTNRLGERPEERPVHLQEVFATVYHQLGIDVETMVLTDPNGRPQYLGEHRRVIQELI